MNILFGLHQLERCLPAKAKDVFEEYEAKMLDNLHRKRLSHDPEMLHLEQEELLTLLDQLSLTCCNMRFSMLCENYIDMEKYAFFSPSSPNEMRIGAPAELTPDEVILYDIPQIKVTFLTREFPTNYCHLLGQHSFPFITVSINNTHLNCVRFTLKLCVFIEKYSETIEELLDIAVDDKRQLPLLPMLPPAQKASLHEITKGTLHIRLSIGTDQHDHTEYIQLLSRHTAILAIKTVDGDIKELVNYLALWVTPHDPKVDEWLSRAAKHHSQRELAGYVSGQSHQESAENVRRQARAIFDMLHFDLGLTYVNSPISFGAQYEQIKQNIRFPSEMLTVGGNANCLDGAILFATLLERVSLDPLILILPYHAVVGWKIARGVEQYEFLDTTLIRLEDFTTAQKRGQEYFEKAQALFQRPLFDFRGYARLIDIRSCRDDGIYP